MVKMVVLVRSRGKKFATPAHYYGKRHEIKGPAG